MKNEGDREEDLQSNVLIIKIVVREPDYWENHRVYAEKRTRFLSVIGWFRMRSMTA